jgi:hypothetical protein
MEEHVGSVRPVGQISDLIDHQNVRVGIGRERLLEVSSLASIGEILDQFRRGGEERLEAVLDGSVPDGHRQMGLSSTGLTVQNQRPSLGDEVQPEVGADYGFPECRLQREVELVDGLEEREVRAPRTTLQSRLLPSRYFFGLGPISDLLVNPARVRQVEAPEVNLELPFGEFQTLQSVVVLLCGHRCISQIFLNLFFFHEICSWKTSEC